MSARPVFVVYALFVCVVYGRPSSSVAVECPPPPSDGSSVYIPHPTDCSLYYQCVDSVPVQMACHPPLFFDPELNVCNWPELVDCSPEEETSPPPDGEETTMVEVEVEEEEVVCPPSSDGFPVFLPHPSDCGLYYECDGDVPVLMSCPEPLHFDPVLSVCNWPEFAHCTAVGTSTPATTETTTEEEEGTTLFLEEEEIEVNQLTCPPSTDGYPVFLPHPTDCGLYYECEGETPVLMACPEPLHFDTRLNVCNWPEFALCGVTTTTTTEPEEETTQEDERIQMF